MALARLSRSGALTLLRECVRTGKIIPGKHFREELANEGLILPDALRVLKTGNIFREPELDPKTGEWKYRVEGNEVDGRWLSIVFCFKEEDAVFLVTAFSERPKGRRP